MSGVLLADTSVDPDYRSRRGSLPIARTYLFVEDSTMKERSILVVGILLTAALTWTAMAQPPQGGGFGRMREMRLNALNAIQEQLTKLKTMMEQAPQGMQGRNPQDMTEEERTKMREEFTKRREEQRAAMAEMSKQMDALKDPRQLMTEQEEALAPLKDLLASAQAEKATATAAKIEKLIADRQKQFQDKMTAMGFSPEMLERMMQRRPPQ